MRIAFFSPLPPVKSGIADYSEALLACLETRAEVEVFTSKPPVYDPSGFDAAIYQIGNNVHHEFAYKMALQYPGIAVLHEANLHHLIAETTIKRGDWDGYLAELEYAGGSAALVHGQRVRSLEIGPDYEGVPMLRRLLDSSKALIVHSDCVGSVARNAGFNGPIARIPHGAWIPDADRLGYRHRLGLDIAAPLIGIFGFLKPYKRIAESLRAFRRVLRLEPHARMILVGEPHPEFPLHALIQQLGLSASVRVLGFTPIEDFVGYIAACDIILNLRFPTVGESSGTLLRSLGLGKAVIVSGIGSFREYPDDICLKVPVDSTEEDHLFEYLNLLVSRPEVARALGARAKSWVERECNWGIVADRYFEFAEAVSKGAAWVEPSPEPPKPHAEELPPSKSIEPEAVLAWTDSEESRTYVEHHLTRLERTLQITPPGGPDDSILEMGAYLQITPALKYDLGYGNVRGCYFGPAGRTDHRSIKSSKGDVFECEIDLFDAEKDTFPYQNERFSTVLCCELLEHLFTDPMHMMSEINRILKPGGHLVLTTPNIVSLRAISAILQGYHPGFFPAYIRPSSPGDDPDARHNREYAPREISLLFEDAGFEVKLLETGAFRDEPKPEHGWVLNILERYFLTTELRGDGIYAVGRKTGPVRERHPAWLYN